MKSENIKGGFRQRKLPLSADYRPMYKIGLVALILGKSCAGEKSSLNKLHLIVWALKSPRNRDFVEKWLESKDFSGIVTWGVEPALNKALSLAQAEGLFAFSGSKYSLTEKGKLLCQEIDKDTNLFAEEKILLSKLGKRGITEAFVNQLIVKTLN